MQERAPRGQSQCFYLIFRLSCSSHRDDNQLTSQCFKLSSLQTQIGESRWGHLWLLPLQTYIGLDITNHGGGLFKGAFWTHKQQRRKKKPLFRTHLTRHTRSGGGKTAGCASVLDAARSMFEHSLKTECLGQDVRKLNPDHNQTSQHKEVCHLNRIAVRLQRTEK